MKKLLISILFIIVVLNPVPVLCQEDFISLLNQARQGDVDAMTDIGILYFYGRQTLKDPFKAKCWVKKAHDKGSERAKKIWDDLKLWQYSGHCGSSFDDEMQPGFSKGSRFTEPVTGMVFRYIPKGCFIMGCHLEATRCWNNEKPAHQVCLEGFWMAAFEVTQGQWESVMGSNPSRFSGDPDRPVENVSFEDVQIFLQKTNKQISGKLSLPTEAQWEYACRNGGQNSNYPWDKDLNQYQANCGICRPGETIGETTPVGQFAPNDIGLYDMAGNVKEWCQDFYDKKAYDTHEKNNPIHAQKESSRVVRGGSYNDNLVNVRCTARDKSLPLIKSEAIGFRVVLTRED